MERCFLSGSQGNLSYPGKSWKFVLSGEVWESHGKVFLSGKVRGICLVRESQENLYCQGKSGKFVLSGKVMEICLVS